MSPVYLEVPVDNHMPGTASLPRSKEAKDGQGGHQDGQTQDHYSSELLVQKLL